MAPAGSAAVSWCPVWATANRSDRADSAIKAGWARKRPRVRRKVTAFEGADEEPGQIRHQGHYQQDQLNLWEWQPGSALIDARSLCFPLEKQKEQACRRTALLLGPPKTGLENEQARNYVRQPRTCRGGRRITPRLEGPIRSECHFSRPFFRRLLPRVVNQLLRRCQDRSQDQETQPRSWWPQARPWAWKAQARTLPEDEAGPGPAWIPWILRTGHCWSRVTHPHHGEHLLDWLGLGNRLPEEVQELWELLLWGVHEDRSGVGQRQLLKTLMLLMKIASMATLLGPRAGKKRKTRTKLNKERTLNNWLGSRFKGWTRRHRFK